MGSQLVVNDVDELHRLLPEIRKINDFNLYEGVERFFIEEVPDYFWNRESSSSGKYHSKDETWKYGLLLHTKRVFTAYNRISRSWKDMGKITEIEQDLGRAAVLLHDTFKYGVKYGVNTNPEGKIIAGKHTVQEHDSIASEQILNKMKLDNKTTEKIAKAVAAHNGPWGCSQNPETNFQLLIHICDMFASDKNAKLAVYQPSREILGLGVKSWGDS